MEADIPGLFYRNVGLRGGPAPVRTYDLQRLLKEVLDGNINPGIVYTSEYTLDDIQEAYAAMDERRTVSRCCASVRSEQYTDDRISANQTKGSKSCLKSCTNG